MISERPTTDVTLSKRGVTLSNAKGAISSMAPFTSFRVTLFVRVTLP
jgi:hypothetical protein